MVGLRQKDIYIYMWNNQEITVAMMCSAVV
jgi:hypothetical protein